MTRHNKSRVRKTWCWRRWINPGQQELWTQRLQPLSGLSWVLSEKVNRFRILLEAYTEQRELAVSLNHQFGGRVRVVKQAEYIQSTPVPPIRIGDKLEIIHEKVRGKAKPKLPRLFIPHGIAFGSGDHATTLMLLRALTRHENWSGITVLDLGTGSGVLALAARLFGARKIVATDFDPDAVRTARQNEALNFPAPLIRWQCGDVKKLRTVARYDLVLANLFSGILCEAAPQIARSIALGGQLWQSGILRSQQKQVIAVYRRQGLELILATSRGKWVMLQWQKNAC